MKVIKLKIYWKPLNIINDIATFNTHFFLSKIKINEVFILKLSNNKSTGSWKNNSILKTLWSENKHYKLQ